MIKRTIKIRAHFCGTGMEAGGSKARPLCGLGVVFAEGGNDKLKIRKDADFEPKTGLSAIINVVSTPRLFRSYPLRGLKNRRPCRFLSLSNCGGVPPQFAPTALRAVHIPSGIHAARPCRFLSLSNCGGVPPQFDTTALRTVPTPSGIHAAHPWRLLSTHPAASMPLNIVLIWEA